MNNIQGWMGVPLISQGILIGFLSLDSKQPGSFVQEHSFLVQSFANQAAVAIEKGRLYSAEQQRARELDALHTATAALLNTLDINDLLNQILIEAMRAIPNADKGSLLLLDQETCRLCIRSTHGYSDVHLQSLSFGENEGYASKAVRLKQPLLIKDAVGDKSICYEGNLPEICAIQSAVVAPLAANDQVIGAISLDSDRPGAFSEADLRLLVTFAATATAALRNAQLHAEVQHMAITDELTGLYNLRGLFEIGRREVERARRYQRPVSAILLDIDHFKQVNDTYGHLTGNQVLSTLANCCQKHVRDIDLVARYGGEEFFILLPETAIELAVKVAERLRTIIAETPIQTDHGQLCITISLGVAGAEADIPELAELINQADAAMYQAKQNGRNRVKMLEPLN